MHRALRLLAVLALTLPAALYAQAVAPNLHNGGAINGSLTLSGNVTASGTVQAGNNFLANTSGNFFANNGVASFFGNVSDGANANAVMIGPYNTYANASAKLLSIASNIGPGSPNVKAYVDVNGLLSTASPATWMKRTGQLILPLTSSTAFTGIGTSVPSVTGTLTAAPAADSSMMMLQCATGAVSGNTAGVVGANIAWTRFDYRPRATAVVRTDSVVTSQRIYVGLSDNDPSGNASLASLNGNRVAVFRFDTGLGDTNWMAITSDGTTASAADTGVAVTASTTYTLQVDMTTAGTAIFRINNASTAQVAKTTNIPTGAGNVSPPVSITTLTTAARNLFIAKVVVEQN